MRQVDGLRSGLDWATRKRVSDSASSVSFWSEVSRRRVRGSEDESRALSWGEIRSTSLTPTLARGSAMDADQQDVSDLVHDQADLSALELADGLLENVVQCPDCSKPLLQSALEDHAPTCQAIREGRPIPASHPLKRRLSEGQPDSVLPPYLPPP
jgi:hypothetical protein